ncbi:hypothetical protein CO669_27700 [Bradyrhizobium sp. Y36]|uniref:hypothetical protein n=1 Tax=Bradyrhizobium sp. Y36 TaxID=2035447 RepID=UPI000BEA3412|nr:hypothetical protein [Bradyrhizobium sp. Y36]PDT87037.1 hypothetical protein CO669_27700 [Bradyrhizobium sp. Y36]
MTTQVATICFPDLDSGDGAVIIVRTAGEAAGLALSLEKGGDIEVFFGSQELDQLIEALNKTRELLSGVKPVV